MNPRKLIPLAAMILAVVLMAMPASAHWNNRGADFGDKDDFGWTIISPDGQAMASALYHDHIDEWKSRFGDEFLIIRDKGDRYVIADEALVQRAKKASREIRNHQEEIGEAARTLARLSLSEMRTGKRQARLEERRRQIEREIDAQERHGESTDALDLELIAVSSELRALRSLQTQNRLSAEEKRDLTRRSDEASERLQRVMDRIDQEMRSIFETAKSRHLAHPVD